MLNTLKLNYVPREDGQDTPNPSEASSTPPSFSYPLLAAQRRRYAFDRITTIVSANPFASALLETLEIDRRETMNDLGVSAGSLRHEKSFLDSQRPIPILSTLKNNGGHGDHFQHHHQSTEIGRLHNAEEEGNTSVDIPISISEGSAPSGNWEIDSAVATSRWAVKTPSPSPHAPHGSSKYRYSNGRDRHLHDDGHAEVADEYIRALHPIRRYSSYYIPRRNLRSFSSSRSGSAVKSHQPAKNDIFFFANNPAIRANSGGQRHYDDKVTVEFVSGLRTHKEKERRDTEEDEENKIANPNTQLDGSQRNNDVLHSSPSVTVGKPESDLFVSQMDHDHQQIINNNGEKKDLLPDSMINNITSERGVSDTQHDTSRNVASVSNLMTSEPVAMPLKKFSSSGLRQEEEKEAEVDLDVRRKVNDLKYHYYRHHHGEHASRQPSSVSHEQGPPSRLPSAAFLDVINTSKDDTQNKTTIKNKEIMNIRRGRKENEEKIKEEDPEGNKKVSVAFLAYENDSDFNKDGDHHFDRGGRHHDDDEDERKNDLVVALMPKPSPLVTSNTALHINTLLATDKIMARLIAEKEVLLAAKTTNTEHKHVNTEQREDDGIMHERVVHIIHVEKENVKRGGGEAAAEGKGRKGDDTTAVESIPPLHALASTIGFVFPFGNTTTSEISKGSRMYTCSPSGGEEAEEEGARQHEREGQVVEAGQEEASSDICILSEKEPSHERTEEDINFDEVNIGERERRRGLGSSEREIKEREGVAVSMANSASGGGTGVTEEVYAVVKRLSSSSSSFSTLINDDHDAERESGRYQKILRVLVKSKASSSSASTSNTIIITEPSSNDIQKISHNRSNDGGGVSRHGDYENKNTHSIVYNSVARWDDDHSISNQIMQTDSIDSRVVGRITSSVAKQKGSHAESVTRQSDYHDAMGVVYSPERIRLLRRSEREKEKTGAADAKNSASFSERKTRQLPKGEEEEKRGEKEHSRRREGEGEEKDLLLMNKRHEQIVREGDYSTNNNNDSTHDSYTTSAPSAVEKATPMLSLCEMRANTPRVLLPDSIPNHDGVHVKRRSTSMSRMEAVESELAFLAKALGGPNANVANGSLLHVSNAALQLSDPSSSFSTAYPTLLKEAREHTAAFKRDTEEITHTNSSSTRSRKGFTAPNKFGGKESFTAATAVAAASAPHGKSTCTTDRRHGVNERIMSTSASYPSVDVWRTTKCISEPTESGEEREDEEKGTCIDHVGATTDVMKTESKSNAQLAIMQSHEATENKTEKGNKSDIYNSLRTSVSKVPSLSLRATAPFAIVGGNEVHSTTTHARASDLALRDHRHMPVLVELVTDSSIAELNEIEQRAARRVESHSYSAHPRPNTSPSRYFPSLNKGTRPLSFYTKAGENVDKKGGGGEGESANTFRREYTNDNKIITWSKSETMEGGSGGESKETPLPPSTAFSGSTDANSNLGGGVGVISTEASGRSRTASVSDVPFPFTATDAAERRSILADGVYRNHTCASPHNGRPSPTGRSSSGVRPPHTLLYHNSSSRTKEWERERTAPRASPIFSSPIKERETWVRHEGEQQRRTPSQQRSSSSSTTFLANFFGLSQSEQRAYLRRFHNNNKNAFYSVSNEWDTEEESSRCTFSPRALV